MSTTMYVINERGHDTLVFDDTEQTRVVRASVLARAEGQGLWLTILNTRFAREVRERGIVARKGRRVGADLR